MIKLKIVLNLQKNVFKARL